MRSLKALLALAVAATAVLAGAATASATETVSYGYYCASTADHTLLDGRQVRIDFCYGMAFGETSHN
jgi:hypothetical protein